MSEVLQLVIDAPQRRNALSRPVLATLLASLTELDERTTGVVLSGRGDAFSSGADFSELTGTSADERYDDDVAAVGEAIRSAQVPVIAAIEGPCLGAAADLALQCDLRVAAEGSYLQVPAVRLGLVYNPASVERLARAYPRDTVRRLLLLGERFTSDEALVAGLVSCLAPRGGAVQAATGLLADITTDELGALAATKELLNHLDTGDLSDAESATHWSERRRALLDSPARKAAVDRARRTHTDNES